MVVFHSLMIAVKHPSKRCHKGSRLDSFEIVLICSLRRVIAAFEESLREWNQDKKLGQSKVYQPFNMIFVLK